MGMYTEIVVKICINKSRIGIDNYNILKYMFNENTNIEIEDLVLPEHPFFKCSRWDYIGISSSFYHHPNEVNDWFIPSFAKTDDEVYIFSRSDLKNYSNEIENFFDWVNTLDIMHPNDFIGYSLYEEDNTPTVYLKK